MSEDDGEFELRLGRIGRQGGSSLTRVRTAIRMTSGVRRAPQTSVATGRSPVLASGLRQVVVRARMSGRGMLKAGGLRAQVRYLAREAAGRDRAETGETVAPEPGLATRRAETPAAAGFYNEREDRLDPLAAIAAWSDREPLLRLIISAEDGEALGDLRPLVRTVMARLEIRLARRLEWIAVDHWDTDNPHSHILVRGCTPDGADLSVPLKILHRDIREDAQDVVTRALGPQRDPDPAPVRHREAAHRGVTGLDRHLLALQARAGTVHARRPELIARLDMLETWGLAHRGREGWRISPDLLAALRAIEQHADVERALSADVRLLPHRPVLAADTRRLTEGLAVHIGPSDAFGDGVLAVIETGRGELRYQRFEREEDMARLQGVRPGAFIAFAPRVAEIRKADDVIAEIAAQSGGIYSARHHLDAVPDASPESIEANLRRLEAMERASLIARNSEGDFIVGHDHLKRAKLHEMRGLKRHPLSAEVLSYLSLEEQVKAHGPTQLDRIISHQSAAPGGGSALALRYADALRRRRIFLVETGWLSEEAAELRPSLLGLMAERERYTLAAELSDELGLPVSGSGEPPPGGIYARRIDAAQGRLALVIGDDRAGLLPWKPVMERAGGQRLEAGLAPVAPALRIPRQRGVRRE